MKRILIVDDNKKIQAMLSACMTGAGFESVVCGDGKAALETILRETFDLIFLDIRLPSMCGTEVLRKMRESDITTPVVVITAHANIRNAIECTRLGAAFYVRKPFSANRILRILEDLGIQGDAQESSAIRQAQDLFERHRYEDVEKFLKNMAHNDILNPEIYRMLSEVALKQQKQRESELYCRIYQSIKE